jgi:ribose transport system substrate-binding protein
VHVNQRGPLLKEYGGKMFKKIVRLNFIVVLLAMLVITACSTGATTAAAEEATTGEEKVQQATTTEAKKSMKIAIMTMNLAQPYFVTLSQGYKDEAADFPGVDVEVVEIDPKGDAAQQVSAIENLKEMGVNALIITAIDPEVVNPSIEEAMKNGMIVVSHYNELSAQTLQSGISTYGMGFVAGQEAADWINNKLGGSAKVALLIWDKTEFDIDRTRGMTDAIKMYSPNAEIVAQQAADSIADGLTAAETILQAHPDIKVFVCYNDEGCLGAFNAVENAGLASDDFGIFGVNASSEALAKIKEGTIYRGTASIDPYHHGRLEMEMAIRLVLGDFLPSKMDIVPVPVTVDNVDQFVE